MRDVHRHAYLVHPLDNRHSKIAQSVVPAFRGSVANQVAHVVGQLRNPLAVAVEVVHVRNDSKVSGILKPEDDSDLALRLRDVEVSGGTDPLQAPFVIRQEAVPAGHEPQIVAVDIETADANRDMERMNAGVLKLTQVFRGKGLRLGSPAIRLVVTQRERTQ